MRRLFDLWRMSKKLSGIDQPVLKSACEDNTLDFVYFG